MPVNGEKINDNKEARLEKKCKSHNLMMKYEERERDNVEEIHSERVWLVDLGPCTST